MDLLRLADVGKVFGSGSSSFWALRHINLLFPSSGLVAIKGKSGSGKSTLLNLMARFLAPSEGRILFEGKDLSSFNGKRLANLRLRGIAMIFQHYNLIEGASALENVELPLLMAGLSPRRARATAHELFKAFGLEALLERNISTASGGEKQRVAIIRSLVNDPKILLADEPTGALDERNSLVVMEMLKRISADRLVIFVSHNEDLIGQYAERTIEIRDGAVVADRGSSKEENAIEEISLLKKRHGKRWVSFFSGRNMKRNGLKNLVCLLAGAVGFSSLLLSLGFYVGSAASLDREKNRSLESQVARIAEKTYSEIPNSPLQLVKQIRPTVSSVLDAGNGIDSLTVENDYSFFLPPFSAYSLNGESQEPCSFLPVFDLSLSEGDRSMLKDGFLPSQNDFSSVLVNEEFASLFSERVVGKAVRLLSQYEISFKGVKQKGEFACFFRIAGVVEEFAFLNSPKVYYSYSGLRGVMRSTPLPEISLAIGRPVTIDSLLEEIAGDHPASSYRYLLFVHRLNDIPKVEALIEALVAEGSFLSIDSSYYQIKMAFKGISEAFSLSLLVFVAVSLTGVGLILAMTCYSNFIVRKKETAILFALGGREEQISSIYINESVSVSLMAAFLSLFLSPFLQDWINRLIEARFGLKNLILVPTGSFFGYRFGLEIILILFSMLIAFFASSIPLSALKRMPLAEELRDE